jgi:hypothetical protein
MRLLVFVLNTHYVVHVQLRVTASQLSRLTGIPMGSIGYLVRNGLLAPSVRRATAQGQPHIFGLDDVAAAITIAQLGLPASSAAVRWLAAFWRSQAGRNLLGPLGSDTERDPKAPGVLPTHQLVVLLPTGEVVVEEDQPVLALTKKYACNVMHVVDVDRIANSSTVAAVKTILGRMVAGPGGRVPRERMSPDARKRRRKELRMAKQSADEARHRPSAPERSR